MTEEICNEQLARGDGFLLENPLESKAFQEPPLKRILNHPQTYVGVSHGCRFNSRSKRDGKLLKKPILFGLVPAPKFVTSFLGGVPTRSMNIFVIMGNARVVM